MSSTIEHFSHPEHELMIKESDVIEETATCSICNKTVVGFPTYTCTSNDDADIHCKDFYLHRSCAELPAQIYPHEKHNQHPLTLILRPDKYICSVCNHKIKFAYACEACDFDLCVACAFPRPAEEQRVLHHEGHQEHPLTLQRRALFTCDACFEEAKDYSYVCIACNIWIHKKCAFSPLIIAEPIYRYFIRCCNICNGVVYVHSWMYYCHKCTYFVHMKCATSTVSTTNEAEGIIEEHWSHPDHPLEQFQFIINENDDDDDDDDDRTTVLICDGCIQPITVNHPSYYGCIQCGFFLHSLCATKLPKTLPVGLSPFHPQHLLVLSKSFPFYRGVQCGVCGCDTNGFYYVCKTCDFKIDLCCAFLPARIKYKSHKHHPLVQHPLSGYVCSASKLTIFNGMGYGCEICSNFRVHIVCMRYPPFFYEGVFYCELCEEQ